MDCARIGAASGAGNIWRGIESCIMNGEIIESYPGDYPYPSCLVLGFTVKGQYIHTVVVSDGKRLWIIMAYYPSLQKWESDYKTRKKVEK